MNMIIYFKETGDDFWLNERTSDIFTINSNITLVKNSKHGNLLKENKGEMRNLLGNI